MSVKRFMLAGGALALLTSSANAALQFSLERVASNAGASGPSTVLLVARDPSATTPFNIAGLTGQFTDLTTNNGLKFYIPDPDSGDYDASGGVNSLGFGARRPAVLGTFLFVPTSGVNLIDGTAPDGSKISTTNDPNFKTGMKSAFIVSSRTGNTTLSVATLTSTGGAVLGAAVVGADTDQVSFTQGSIGSVGADNNAAPDLIIPNLSTADVPEPAGLCFLGVVGAGTLLRRRRHANA